MTVCPSCGQPLRREDARDEGFWGWVRITCGCGPKATRYARATAEDIQGWGKPSQPQGEDEVIVERMRSVVLEPGWYAATVADVQPVSGQYGEQLEFTFLLTLPDGGQRRIRAWASPKFAPGTKLYAWCESIFGRAIPPTYDLDTEHLLNRAVDVRLERKQGSRGAFAKVVALAKAGSMTAGDADTPFA